MKNNNIKQLVEALTKANNYDEMLDLLEGLLTVGELEEISIRLQIVKLLKSGVSQREISTKLKVGIATVTRGSREIKHGRFANI